MQVRTNPLPRTRTSLLITAVLLVLHSNLHPTLLAETGPQTVQTPAGAISNVPSFIIFTAVSGGWDNDPVDDATLPADFVIDYVRVWQLKELASPVDSPAIGVSAASQTR